MSEKEYFAVKNRELLQFLKDNGINESVRSILSDIPGLHNPDDRCFYIRFEGIGNKHYLELPDDMSEDEWRAKVIEWLKLTGELF